MDLFYRNQKRLIYLLREKKNIYKKNGLMLFFFCLLLFPALYASAEPSVEYESNVNWKSMELEIAVDVRYPPDSAKLRMRNDSENIFDEKFFDIFTSSISESSAGKVYFNSTYTMEDMIQKNPAILNKIESIKNNAVMVYNVYHEDMSGVKMLYRINILRDIASCFISHRKPYPVHEKYLWVPNEKYTGVVIYAKGDFPVRGESAVSPLKPSVFPSVYSAGMEKILSAELVDPEVLVRWGTAGFTDIDDDPVIRERAGDNPLYTMAEEIFGRNRTDIIVPSDTSDLLFYRRLNEDLVREGRFVIIADLP